MTKRPASLRITTWNTAKRIRALAGQVDAIAELAPDIVVLQEVTRNTVAAFRTHLPLIGLAHVLDSLATHSLEENGTGRVSGVLIASRFPLERQPQISGKDAWTERVLSVHARLPDGVVEVHGAYIPTGSCHEYAKAETLAALQRHLAVASQYPRILCGDFNTPQAELSDGSIITFACKRATDGSYRLILRRGPEWDALERMPWKVLCGFDLHDAYRVMHGPSHGQVSWCCRRNGRQFGYRLDHIFTPRALAPAECFYSHQYRERRLSDHSPLTAALICRTGDSAG